MAKYYAVYKGKSGLKNIYKTWDECKNEVHGFKGAVYKSFKTEDEAMEYFQLLDKGINSTSPSLEDNKKEGLYIYVDGSFSLDKGNYSYGLIAILDGEEIYEDNGVGDNEDAALLRNVAGEILGAIKAAEYAINNNYKEVTIVYDYQGIENWAIGTWKRNKELTIEYNIKMQEYMKKIKINFLKVKGHSGDKYNEIVDKLAKKALGIIS